MEILFPPAPDVAPQAKVDHGHGGGCLAEHAGGFWVLLTVRAPQKQLAKVLRQLFFIGSLTPLDSLSAGGSAVLEWPPLQDGHHPPLRVAADQRVGAA